MKPWSPSLCKKCGGRCCKRMPGIASPEDINCKGGIKTVLESGKWAIDWYEGDPRPGGRLNQVYYLRPRIRGFNHLYHPAWADAGECIFLRENGCFLSPDDRPLECRDLVPKENYDCQAHYTKKELAMLWIKYQKKITATARTITERSGTRWGND